jgi:hypothetical protein
MLAGMLSKKDKAKDPPDLRYKFHLSDDLIKPLTPAQGAEIRRRIDEAVRQIGLDRIKRMEPVAFGRLLAQHFGIGFIDVMDHEDYESIKEVLKESDIRTRAMFIGAGQRHALMVSVKNSQHHLLKGYPSERNWTDLLLEKGKYHAYIITNSNALDTQISRGSLHRHIVYAHEIAEYLVAEYDGFDDDLMEGGYWHNNILVHEREMNLAYQLGILEETFRDDARIWGSSSSYGERDNRRKAEEKYRRYLYEKRAFFERTRSKGHEPKTSSPVIMSVDPVTALMVILVAAGKFAVAWAKNRRAKRSPDLRKPFRVSRKLKRPMSRWQKPAREG